MFDAKIISACIKSRQAFQTCLPHVDVEEFTPTGKFWWKLVVDWYSTDSKATGVDFDLLLDRGVRSAGRSAQIASEWLSELPDAPSPENVAWEVLELKREVKWREFSAHMEGERNNQDKSLELAGEHYELLKATSLDVSSIDYGSDLEDLVAVQNAKAKIPLFPEKLNDKVDGGAMAGTHIVVFGRKEAGKTLFAVNMVAGWLRRGYRVLYVGNEDSVDLIKARISWNLSGMTKSEFEKHENIANQRCRDKGWKNLIVAHLWPGTSFEIEKLIKEHEPHCLVVDQIRNLRAAGKRQGTRAQALDAVACEIRQLLSKYSLVGLSLGQANAGEHGKDRVQLETDDFDESRTGVPGQSDLMVGIGFNASLDAHNQRHISIPANKLSGDHEGFVITFDKYRSSMT